MATSRTNTAAAAGAPTDSDGRRLMPDAAALQAASKIGAAVAVMSGAQRRSAHAALKQPLSTVSDPRSPGPVRLSVPTGQSRAFEALAGAGGADLRDAAQRLAQWADPVVSVRRLQHRLARTLPADEVGETTAVIARRVLCDSAGLVLRPGARHAASFDAVAGMARAAKRCSDDVGVIDEDAITAWAAGRGWDHHLEALAEACGFVRLSGRLVFRDNRLCATKAALLSLGTAASPDEIAHVACRDKRSVAIALTTCSSIIAVGPQMWAVAPCGRAEAPEPDRAEGTAQALVLEALALADDTGLIDRGALAHLAERDGWPDSIEDLIQRCGLVTVAGMLSTKATHTAAAKAALLGLGGSATTAAVAEAAAMKPHSVDEALRHCASVERRHKRRRTGHWRVTPVRRPSAPPAKRSRLDGPQTQQRRSLSDADRQAGARSARCFADDVGLVDEEALKAWATRHEIPVKASQLASAFGLSRVRGRLALSVGPRADAKAGLLDRGRAATTAELARGSRHDSHSIAGALERTPSVLRVGHHWIVDTDDGAIRAFAGAATSLTDDAGLIDEPRLRAEMDALGWADRVDEMTAACGFVRIFGRLAVEGRAGASVKAALLDLDRPAHTDEIATITGIDAKQVKQQASRLHSVVTARPHMWAAATAGGGAYASFAAAAAVCRDEVGIIDETRLGDIAAAGGWPLPVQHLAQMWGLPRLRGRLVASVTAAAAAKTALLELGRPATLGELQELTGYRSSFISAALNGRGRGAAMPKTGPHNRKTMVSLS